MTIKYCEKCRGYTPEGFALCPPCMKAAGANADEIQTVTKLLEVVNVINIGDTDISRRAAVESILKIKNRLEERAYAEK